MSVEAMAIALQHSAARQATQRLVLLGIANHDGDGGSYPAVGTLAHYAACDDRTVQRAIDQLVQLGEIAVQYNGGAIEGRHATQQPNRYQFLLTCPPNCDRSARHRLLCTHPEHPTDRSKVLDQRKLGRRALICQPCRLSVDNAVESKGGIMPGGDLDVTRTVLLTKQLDQSPYVPERARARALPTIGACGDPLIEPGSGYCIRGCPPREVRAS